MASELGYMLAYKDYQSSYMLQSYDAFGLNPKELFCKHIAYRTKFKKVKPYSWLQLPYYLSERGAK